MVVHAAALIVEAGALRNAKEVRRFTRKKEVVRGRKFRSNDEASPKIVNAPRNRAPRTRPKHAVKDLYRVIEDSEKGSPNFDEEDAAVQAIKDLKQGIKRLKKSLPDTSAQRARRRVVREDGFTEFEHEMVFK